MMLHADSKGSMIHGGADDIQPSKQLLELWADRTSEN